MANIPEEYRYTREHEWALRDDDGTILVGITDYAQQQLGDIVYVELPKEGDLVARDEPFGVVESTKSVSDLFAPVSGRVVEINEVVVDSPEVLNDDPYGDAWLVRVQPSDPDEYDRLLTAAEYEALVEAAEEE